MLLRKCGSAKRAEVRRIFEKEAFGELERLVTQTTLAIAQALAREELHNDDWLRLVGDRSGRSLEQMRIAVPVLLDTGVFHGSIESCVSLLDPIVETWDIDLKSFGIEIVLNPQLAHPA